MKLATSATAVRTTHTETNVSSSLAFKPYNKLDRKLVAPAVPMMLAPAFLRFFLASSVLAIAVILREASKSKEPREQGSCQASRSKAGFAYAPPSTHSEIIPILRSLVSTNLGHAVTRSLCYPLLK